jgi:hypothetical protein
MTDTDGAKQHMKPQTQQVDDPHEPQWTTLTGKISYRKKYRRSQKEMTSSTNHQIPILGHISDR